jgi:ankyrin repeat protein
MNSILAAIDPEDPKANCLAIVKLLVKHKASVDVVSKSKRSPLMQACGTGNLDLVKYVLSLNKTNIKAIDENKESCFLIACRHGRAEVVCYLLSEYEDQIDRKDDTRSLIYACVGENAQVVRELISKKRCDVNSRIEGEEALTALMVALNLDSDVIAQLILDQSSIDIHATAKNGWNVLFWAAENGHQKVVERLLNMEIDVFHGDKEGWTALMVAVRSDETEIANLILSHSSCGTEQINMVQVDGWSALSIAVALDRRDLAKLLITKESNVNICIDPIAIFSEMKNSLYKRMKRIGCIGDATTPLIVLAALCEHVEILKMLCEAGADLSAKTAKGYTVFDVVRKGRNRKEMQAVLSEYRPNYRPPLLSFW